MGKTIGERRARIMNSKPRIKLNLTLTRLGRIFKMKKYKV